MKSARERMGMIAAYRDVGNYRGNRRHLRDVPQDGPPSGRAGPGVAAGRAQVSGEERRRLAPRRSQAHREDPRKHQRRAQLPPSRRGSASLAR